MKADGTILIDTKISDDGMEQGFRRIEKGMDDVSISVRKMGQDIESTFSKIDVSKPIENASAKVKQLEQQLHSVTMERNLAVADGDDAAAQRLDAKMTSIYDRLEAAREKLAIEVAAAADKQAAAEEKAARRSAKAAEKEAAAKQRAQEKQFRDATKTARRFGSRFREIVAGALVFNLLSAGLRNITEYFGKALKSNTAFTKSFARLKGAFYTAFQPVYEYVLPVLIRLMDILAALMSVVGRFFAALGGQSYDQVRKNAKAMNEQAEAIGGVGGAAEKAKKQLMGFDEINKLNAQDSGGGGGGGGSSGIIPANFDDVEVTTKLQNILKLVGSIAAGLLAWKIASAFTTSLAMAAGIGLAVGGALFYAFNWADAFANGISWENLTGMLLGAGVVVAGLGLAFGTTGAAVGLLVAGVGLVVVALREWIATGELSNEACVVLVAGIMAIGAALSLLTGSWIPAVVAAVVAFVLAAVTKGQELKELINSVAAYFGDFGEAIAQILGGLIDFIQGVFTGNWQQAWVGIVGIVTGAVNGIISVVNGMIATVINGINAIFQMLSFNIQLPGGGSIGLNLPQFSVPQIPYLAKGAVIPPNREFMAVLGDQRHGNNIEAPEDLIRKIVREESGGNIGDIQINFTGSLSQLARILQPEIHRQERNASRAGGR